MKVDLLGGRSTEREPLPVLRAVRSRPPRETPAAKMPEPAALPRRKQAMHPSVAAIVRRNREALQSR